MALGTSEATPLQMAAAYSAFANGGEMFEPTVIARVVDINSGETIVNGPTTSRQVIKPATAYMITDMLSAVTQRGTARRANGSFKDVAIAGKTGTSRDGWFVGYTPNLVCAVWIGFDDNQQLGLTGAEAALPAWIDFMKEALAIRPSLGGRSFPKPRGITSVKIDPETGLLAGPYCPTAQTVSVASRFAPIVECLKHLPQLESVDEAYDVSLESSDETSILSTGLRAVGLNQSEESSDKLSARDEVNSHLDGERQTAAQPKPNSQQPTQTELNQSGRASLVSAPVITNDYGTSKVARERP
jgi:membrane carboxypeptidase/penicillin-binding protein